MSTIEIKNFQKLLAQKKLDGYLVTNISDQVYLSWTRLEGFSLLVTKKQVFCYTGKMLVAHLKKAMPFAQVIETVNSTEAVKETVKKLKLKKVAFDSSAVLYDRGLALAKAGLTPLPGLVSELRMVKLPHEIKRLTKAGQVISKALTLLEPHMKAGVTELELRFKLEEIVRDLGAFGQSFDIIVATGANAAKPHHCTSNQKIKNNSALLIDCGATYYGYKSDITRTYFIGKPSAEFKNIHAIVQKAHDEGLKAVKPKVKCCDVDKVCRGYISDKGYGDYFIHTTGHGVGLDIHEAPSVSKLSQTVLKEGMVITVEPGIYFENKFGVRIEDTLLVTANGYKNLTK